MITEAARKAIAARWRDNPYRGHRQGWRVVDISGRAVEENAARILRLLEDGA